MPHLYGINMHMLLQTSGENFLHVQTKQIRTELKDATTGEAFVIAYTLNEDTEW